MAEQGNRRPTRTGNRPQSNSAGPSHRPRTGGGRPSGDKLQELADELEEYGRALLAKARELRRSSGPSGASEGGREWSSGPSSERRPRSGTSPQRATKGERKDESEGGRGKRSAGGGEQRRSSGDSPDWAPTPKRRRT